MKKLNNNSPNIEPWGNVGIMFIQVLKLLLTWTLCFFLLNSFSYTEEYSVKCYTSRTWKSLNNGVMRHKSMNIAHTHTHTLLSRIFLQISSGNIGIFLLLSEKIKPLDESSIHNDILSYNNSNSFVVFVSSTYRMSM